MNNNIKKYTNFINELKKSTYYNASDKARIYNPDLASKFKEIGDLSDDLGEYKSDKYKKSDFKNKDISFLKRHYKGTLDINKIFSDETEKGVYLKIDDTIINNTEFDFTKKEARILAGITGRNYRDFLLSFNDKTFNISSELTSLDVYRLK